MSLMYAGSVSATQPGLAKEYRCWGLSQVRYVLGDTGRSLVVGYGRNPPKRTQDRAAACPDPPEVGRARWRLWDAARGRSWHVWPAAGCASRALQSPSCRAPAQQPRECSPQLPWCVSHWPTSHPLLKTTPFCRPQVCNRVTGLLSPDPDPHELRGALVYGSGRSDSFEDARKADSNRVGVENNAGLAAALAGVVEVRDLCEAGAGWCEGRLGVKGAPHPNL